MKTVKEIANELGVSRQTIYRRLSTLPSNMVSMDRGGHLINADGMALLRNMMLTHGQVGQVMDTLDTPLDMEFYKKEVERLQSELQLEREHNRRLADKIAEHADKFAEQSDKLMELTRNSQVLQLKVQDLLLAAPPPEKPRKKSKGKKSN